MQCTRCGREVRGGSSFCPSCGEPVRPAPYEAVSDETPAPPGPSPFSREAGPLPPTPTPPAPPVGPTPHPPPAAPDAFRFQGQVPPVPSAPATRTFTEMLAAFSSGVLGAVVAAAFGALHVLAAFVTALNDDEFSKPAFLVLGLLVVTVVVVATVAMSGRARVARAQGRPLDVVEAMALGGGVLTSTYGVLLLLTAAFSEGGQALNLVF